MTRTPIHPGEVLADEIQARDSLTATELARQIHVSPGRISEIMSGKRAITADTAIRLGKFFGTEAEFWMNLQKSYELRVAWNELDDEIDTIQMHV